MQGELYLQEQSMNQKIDQDTGRRRREYFSHWNGGKMGSRRGEYSSKKHHRDQPHSSENMIFFKNNIKALHTNCSSG